jgi:hypothetical protein
MTARVDLLRGERSKVDRWVATIYSPTFRRSLSVWGTIVAIVVGTWLIESIRLTVVNQQLSALQDAYRGLQVKEKQADVVQDNYAFLTSMVSSIALLQHSIVDRAQEIVDIVNVTHRHQLAVTELSDFQADQGASSLTWELKGNVTDHRRRTCHEVVADALPGFMKVPNIVSAIPEHNTRQSNPGSADSNECDFDMRLARMR